MLRDGFSDNRIDAKMGIAQSVDVSGGASDVCWHVHQANALRGLDSPWFARFEFWIARVLQKGRQPAELKLGPAIDQDVGVAQRNNETRPRINEVRVFGGLGQNNEVDFVAADFSGERTEIGQGGNDIQLRLCDQRESKQERAGYTTDHFFMSAN